MLGKIISIGESVVEVELTIDLSKAGNLINYHVVIESSDLKLIGEIKQINGSDALINLLGELKDNTFVSGIIRRPSFDSVCRIITKEELDILLGNKNINKSESLYIGGIPMYNNYPVNIRINDFFSNHFAIFGNTGSGKSYGVTRLLQNLFYRKDSIPINSNIFLFDVYGEYHNAFSKLKEYSPHLNFKTYTTNLNFSETEVLRIPLWLLGVDDLALLLGADNHIQLPIIEKALRLVSVFAKEEESVFVYKNDIIARALLQVLYSGNQPSQIRDQIFAILTVFNTSELNLESKIVQPGYVRTLRQCLVIDRDGKLSEMKLVTEFVTQFITDNLELKLPDGSFKYNLNHLKDAFEFALISEGILKSDKVYDYANILRVRLHALINSDYSEYFKYDEYITKNDYINQLLTTVDGKKAQIVNFNISYIDDRLAKTITKIYSKMLYDYATSLKQRTTMPIHIILEEAHRYVQNDKDIFLLGYNIFDRITKEGRKYGVLLGLISQRPSELSETSLSQCSNFLIFKTVHPNDLTFIREMVPDITVDIVDKLKILRPGNCVVFGLAFKLPIIIKFDLPNPEPESYSADISKLWFENNVTSEEVLDIN